MQLQLGMEFFREKRKERPYSFYWLQCFNTKCYQKGDRYSVLMNTSKYMLDEHVKQYKTQ
jgi:predicted transposase YdaD